jgi:hypothetical protein
LSPYLASAAVIVKGNGWSGVRRFDLALESRKVTARPNKCLLADRALLSAIRSIAGARRSLPGYIPRRELVDGVEKPARARADERPALQLPGLRAQAAASTTISLTAS